MSGTAKFRELIEKQERFDKWIAERSAMPQSAPLDDIDAIIALVVHTDLRFSDHNIDDQTWLQVVASFQPEERAVLIGGLVLFNHYAKVAGKRAPVADTPEMFADLMSNTELKSSAIDAYRCVVAGAVIHAVQAAHIEQGKLSSENN